MLHTCFNYLHCEGWAGLTEHQQKLTFMQYQRVTGLIFAHQSLKSLSRECTKLFVVLLGPVSVVRHPDPIPPVLRSVCFGGSCGGGRSTLLATKTTERSCFFLHHLLGWTIKTLLQKMDHESTKFNSMR